MSAKPHYRPQGFAASSGISTLFGFGCYLSLVPNNTLTVCTSTPILIIDIAIYIEPSDGEREMTKYVLLALLAFAMVAVANVPHLLNVQGLLTDSQGEAVADQTHSIVFAIYNVESGGTALWSETRDVTTSGGLFAILLGEVTPMPASIFDGSDLWLGITVESDAEMTPRQQLVTVPYVFQALTVADSSIQLADLAQNGAATDQIIKWNGTSWTIADDEGGSGSGAGGWTDDGRYVRLTASSDSVGIGTNAPEGKLHVLGNALIEGKTTFGTGHTNSGDHSAIGGGTGSTASGDGAVVSGGDANIASGELATIGGGQGHWAGGDFSTVAGGAANNSYGKFSTVAGGGPSDVGNPLTGNRAAGDYSAIGGGGNNQAGDENLEQYEIEFATVGGGESNYASRDHSTVSGGENNIARAHTATVSGGYSNVAEHGYATVGGGANNYASGQGSTVGGGEYCLARGDWSVVAGGGGTGADSNSALGTGAVISGGYTNVASGGLSTISGGSHNSAESSHSTIGGGILNEASGQGATVGGGEWNQVTAKYGTIAGGGPWGESEPEYNCNKVTDDYGTVGGGTDNMAGDDAGTSEDAQYATVAGGVGNSANGESATVAGGGHNHVYANLSSIGGGGNNFIDAEYSTIGGGLTNRIQTDFATIGGGRYNLADAAYGATIAGGQWNKVAAEYGTIGGGGYSEEADGNRVSDAFGTVGGGRRNQAGDGGSDDNSACYATVGGGFANTASGRYSTVPGGNNCTAFGQFSFAAGKMAEAQHDGCFVWGDNTTADIASTGTNQFIARASGGVWFWSNSSATTGVKLDPGSGSWSNASSRELKTDFAETDVQTLLQKLTEIPVESWRYKSEDPQIHHLGPIAEDFYAAFGLGADNKSITTMDAIGVALAAIQALHENEEELRRSNEELRRLNEELQARIEALEASE
jgi:hypothetical protein